MRKFISPSRTDIAVWCEQDGEGGICVVNQPTTDIKVERLMDFNAGGIVGLATCPWAHFAVTAGADGSVRLYDYREKNAQMYSKRFDQPASFMLMMPEHMDESQRVVVVGFQDGMVRVLLRGKSEWKLMGVMKPHKKAVTSIAVSPSGKMLASASKDGSIFFFTVADAVTYVPLAFTVVEVCPLAAGVLLYNSCSSVLPPIRAGVLHLACSHGAC